MPAAHTLPTQVSMPVVQQCWFSLPIMVLLLLLVCVVVEYEAVALVIYFMLYTRMKEGSCMIELLNGSNGCPAGSFRSFK